MSKFDRKNQAKQKRLANRKERAQETQVFAGKNGAPRIVAVVALCDSVSTLDAVRSLNASLDIEDEITSGLTHLVNIDRFKQKIQYLTPQTNLIAVMDACRVADYVLFVLPSDKTPRQLHLDFIQCVESQGISNVYTAIQGLADLPQRTVIIAKSSCKRIMKRFLPQPSGIFSLDSAPDLQNMIRSICTTVPKGISWREERSWILVEHVDWPPVNISKAPADTADLTTNLVITGVVRGRNLKADRLVQIGDWGAFQVDKIVAAPLDTANSLQMDVSGQDLDTPTEDQDNLDELAPEETVMSEAPNPSIAPSERRSVLLDDLHTLSEDEEEQEQDQPTRLPKGTSRYQSAWYIGDVSDSGSDMEDLDLDLDMTDELLTPADGIEGASKAARAEPSEPAMSDDDASELDTAALENLSLTDKAEAAALAEYREQKKKAAEEDLAFPDEIELTPDMTARDRLARYRGLKSLRTSAWNTDEDLLYQPADFDRLLEVSDPQRAKSKVLRETLVGGVRAGTRVHIHVRNVPLSLKQTHDPAKPLTLFSLLRHEHKRTVVDVSISLNSSYPEPLKSKEQLVMQAGPRRFVLNPLFSQGKDTPNNVHKFLRFLHPGQTAVASFTAPLTWGAVPLLFFKQTADLAPPAANPESEAADPDADPDASMDVDVDADTADTKPSKSTQPLTLIAKGTMLPPTATHPSSRQGSLAPSQRIIAKRIVLTGQPFKIHRKLVTVRYMFFNAGDVAFFRALPLWTNRGRQGVVKESLGTHGYFKATFDGSVGMNDAVGVSLYKRVWPRAARAFTEGDKMETTVGSV